MEHVPYVWTIALNRKQVLSMQEGKIKIQIIKEVRVRMEDRVLRKGEAIMLSCDPAVCRMAGQVCEQHLHSSFAGLKLFRLHDNHVTTYSTCVPPEPNILLFQVGSKEFPLWNMSRQKKLYDASRPTHYWIVSARRSYHAQHE